METVIWVDHNHVRRDRLGPGSAWWPRIPGVDAVRVTEPSVIQLLSPSIVRSFHLAVEPNTCSLEIGSASEWTRADVKLLAVFSDKETELFFRIPIHWFLPSPTLLRAVRDTNRFTDVEKEKAAWKRPSCAGEFKEGMSFERTHQLPSLCENLAVLRLFERLGKSSVGWSRQVGN